MDSILLISITVGAVIAAVVYHFFKNRDLPPGPIGLPFIGYWPFLKEQTLGQQLLKMKERYGDVFSFTSSGRLYMNLASIKVLREAHVSKSDCFAGRFTDFNLLSYVFKDGVGFINGEPWRVQRKFFLQAMRDRGMMSVRDSLSGPLVEAVNSAVEDLKKSDGQPVNLIELVTRKCTSVLRATLFGESGVKDEVVQEINELYASIMGSMTPCNLLLTGNFARYALLPLQRSYRIGMAHHEKVMAIIYGIIDEHKKTYDRENPRDIIDEYFVERDARRSKKDPTSSYFTDAALMSSLEQLIGDGVLSVAGFVCIVLKALLDHPQEQKRVYDEIMEVIGEDRQPSVEDRQNLTFTNAFILEAIRTSEFFALIPVLECTKETTIRGYRIPKGTISVIDVYSCHVDPEEFEEPDKFNPSRYIVSEGKRRPELPISFGVGKRACIGESFTMMQVFLFLTTIIKNLDLTIPDDVNTTTFNDYMEGNLKVVARPRK